MLVKLWPLVALSLATTACKGAPQKGKTMTAESNPPQLPNAHVVLEQRASPAHPAFAAVVRMELWTDKDRAHVRVLRPSGESGGDEYTDFRSRRQVLVGPDNTGTRVELAEPHFFSKTGLQFAGRLIVLGQDCEEWIGAGINGAKIRKCFWSGLPLLASSSGTDSRLLSIEAVKLDLGVTRPSDLVPAPNITIVDAATAEEPR